MIKVFFISWLIWYVAIQFISGVKYRRNVAAYGEIADARKHPVAAFIGWLIGSAFYAGVTTLLIWFFS